MLALPQMNEPAIKKRLVMFTTTWDMGKKLRMKIEMPKSFSKDKSRLLNHDSSKLIFTDFKIARGSTLDL